MGKRNITDEQLLAYAAGSLSDAEAAAVESHLARNADDAQTVARYRQVRMLAAADDGIEPSAKLLASAKAIYERHAQPTRLGWIEAVEQFIAKLVFDSRVQPVALRYTDAGQRVNLTFEGQGAEIDLQAERMQRSDGAERWQIMGQICSIPVEAVAGRPIALIEAGTHRAVAEAVADDRGGFSLQATSGRFDLYIELPDGVLALPGLELED